VSNAVFAVARAREYLADDGIDVYFVPEFDKEFVRGEGEETRTVIVFRICKAAGSAPTPLVADEEE
jgi:stage V sporulation protein SpoVS